jgi:tRNA-Thr(GGU) m(6)t(6)A37 methyltransferase TsaA
MLEEARADGRRSLALTVVGMIHTPYRTPEGTPIQSRFGEGIEATVTVREEYADALTDIEGFERLWLVYWLDRAGPYAPLVVPYRDDRSHGLFATRAPARPNPIGLSVVRLLAREGALLRVADIDVLDGTPLVDIKPYVPEFDAYPDSKAGWFDCNRVDRTRADGRFHGRG